MDINGRSAATGPSSKVCGKQRERTTHTSPCQPAAVLVFVPRSLFKASRQGRWTASAPHTESGLLGWAMPASGADGVSVIVVAGLASSRNRPHDQANRASWEPTIVGKCTAHPLSDTSTSDSDSAAPTAEALSGQTAWVTLCRSGRKLAITALRSALRPSSDRCAIHLIEYSAPDPGQMQFYALEPMLLSPTATSKTFKYSQGDRDPEDDLQQKRLERLVRLDPLRFRDLNTQYAPGDAPGERFRTAIEQVNHSRYLMQRTQAAQNGHVSKLGKSTFLHRQAVRVLKRGGCLLRATQRTLNLSIATHSLMSVSASARQLDLRIGQVLLWPELGLELRSRRLREHEPVAGLAPSYTSLYNGVWLIANDLILGWAIGTWLQVNSTQLASTAAASLKPVLIGFPIDTLDWLDNWPTGVKLNSQLSRFFRDVYTAITQLCGDAILEMFSKGDGHHLRQTLYWLGTATRFFGLSMLLCLLIDMFRLATMHATLCYKVQRAIFVYFCSSLRSLFHLFRGKKRNPLRNMRVDAAAYDLDQLLLGTLFFTLFVFLWLTVAAYYVQFAAFRLGIVVVVVLLQTAVAMLNHLPLFALMLRIKDPLRLPGGVLLVLQDEPPEESLGRADGGAAEAAAVDSTLPCTRFVLQNTPLSIADIFRGYYGHLRSLRNLPQLILDATIGRPI